MAGPITNIVTLDGVEKHFGAVRALDGVGGRIAIIGVSGRAEDEEPSLAAGADGFLTKPVSPRALATALLQAVKR